MDAPNPPRHQIFVSYSRQDAEWAGAFVATLGRRGWRVFLDTRSIRVGDEWSSETDAAIDAAKVVIVLWSARSVRSSYVIAEVARAVVRGTLIPLSIDRTLAPPAFRRFQTQPMHIAGATKLPPDLVTLIEMRNSALEPPAPSSVEEQHLRNDLARSAALARERGVPLLALQTQLERLGEVDVAPEAVPARLENFVSEFLKLKAELARATNLAPDVAASQGRALDLMNAGDLDGARALIDDALTRRRELFQQTARETATLLADRAHIDMMQVRYAEAITSYEEAATIVGFDTEVALGYLASMVDVLIRQGDEFGDNEAPLRAVEVISKRALPLVSRDRTPIDWAQLQSRLAKALRVLGIRDKSTSRLKQAVVAHQAALSELTRDCHPEDWAAGQSSLGNVLVHLGDREKSTACLEEAVTAFRAALEVFTRRRDPLRWAGTQNNLSNALRLLGESESNMARLEEAVAACREALEECTRDRAPLDWAKIQNTLGNAVQALGMRESGTVRLEEAVAARRETLKEITRDRYPLLWALAQNNLGEDLALLGTRENSKTRLEEAVAAYRAALEVLTQDHLPSYRETTQGKLDQALSILAKRSLS